MSTRNPALKPYTFKDTGREVCIKKVSPLLVMELQKSFPPPKPPLQKVDYGDGQEHWEANPSHPDYLQAMSDYNFAFQERLQRLMVKRGVSLTWTEEMRTEVAELRDFWKTEFEKELDPDDGMVYVLMICVGSDKDLEELLEAIARRAQPTEGAVNEALNSFQG